MPAVNVRPGILNNSHDLSLSTGSEIIGLIYADNTPRVLQEIPISDPARPFTAQQKNWTGGAGRLRYQDDPQGYSDSYGLWTMTDGKMMPAPQWKYGSGYRSCDSLMPGDVKLQSLYDATYISVAFVASATYNADKALLWLDWEGVPGTLTLSLCPDSAGSPNLAGALKTATMTVSGATRYGPNELDWTTTQALSASTTYHLVLNAGDQNARNYWRVAVDVTGVASKTSTNGTVWNAAAYTMYYRVVDADISRQWFFISMYGATYAISKNDDESAALFYINGDRGRVTTGGSGTTFSDSSSGVSSGWTTNEWAGYKVRIINGPGTGLWRTITTNTATQITVSVAWGATLTAGSEYIIYDGPKWQAIDSTGFGNPTGKPIPGLTGWELLLPQGQSDYVRRVAIDYAQATIHKFEDDGTNAFDLIAAFNNPKAGPEVWGASADLAQVKHAPSVGFGAGGMTFSSAQQIGTPSSNITNMVAGADLYILKEDSIWRMSDTYLPSMVDSGLGGAQDLSNGVAAFLAGDLWFGWSHSIQKTEGSVFRDMLNYRLGSTGMPRGGVPRCGISALGWKFFAMDNESTTDAFGRKANFGTRSCVIAWNGLGWQEIFRSWKASGRIRNVFWQANPGGRSKLWCDVNGELVYIQFPLFAANPLLDSALPHQHYAEWISSIFDGSDISVSKLINSIRLIADDDDTGKWEIIVDWQADKDLYTTNWYQAGALKNISTDEFIMNVGNVREWRLRLRMYTEDAESPAVLNSFTINGWMFPLLKYQWVGTYKLDANQYTFDGNQDFDPDVVLDFLRDAFENSKSIRLRSMTPTMDMKTIAVSAPLVMRNWVRVEDGKSNWGGTIQVALREA